MQIYWPGYVQVGAEKVINRTLVDRWSSTGRRQGRRCGWYWMPAGSSVWSLDVGRVVGLVAGLSARAKPEPKGWKQINSSRKRWFCPNKDSLSSICWVSAGDGRIELVSGTGKRQAGEVAAKAAGTGNQQDRHHWQQKCPSSRRVGTQVRRPEFSFLQQGRVLFGWAAGIVKFLPPGRLLHVCLLTACFDDSRENRRRYSNSRLETSFPKQGRIRDQIRSRINFKLWDRSWSVPVVSVNHKKWGLSRNNSKGLDQQRCASVSLGEVLE